jgi:hypothetical protein
VFIAAFLLASKICCDDVYSLASWSKVACGLFRPTTLFAAELALCVQLRWRLHIRLEDIYLFEARVRADHAPLAIRRQPSGHGVQLVRRARIVKKARAHCGAERTQLAVPRVSPYAVPRPRRSSESLRARTPRPAFALESMDPPQRYEDMPNLNRAANHEGAEHHDLHGQKYHQYDQDVMFRTGTVRSPRHTISATPFADPWLSLRHM